MYIIFGILAAVTTDIFLYSSLSGQEPKWYLFVLGLSITALENRSWVNDICMRTLVSDWSYMQDVVPSLSEVC